MYVHVLQIDLNDGQRISAHKTYEGAQDELFRYVMEYWTDVFPPEDVCPLFQDMTIDDAVHYFDDGTGWVESYDIRTLLVEA